MFPGIPLPPITDLKIISLQALLPGVDPWVMKKVLDDTFVPTDVLLLVPLKSRNKAKALLRDDFLDMANIARDPRDFTMIHLAPAIYNYAAIVIYFAPDRTKGPLAAAFATYIGRLLSWAERYFFRAILQYHVHFHARIISLQGVYRAEAWSAEAPHLMGSYITPNVHPISYEPRKRQHTDSGGSRPGGAGGGGNGSTGRGDGRCWNWNAGRPCRKEPCGFTHMCSVDGCVKSHKAVDHRLERKLGHGGGAGPLPTAGVGAWCRVSLPRRPGRAVFTRVGGRWQGAATRGRTSCRLFTGCTEASPPCSARLAVIFIFSRFLRFIKKKKKKKKKKKNNGKRMSQGVDKPCAAYLFMTPPAG